MNFVDPKTVVQQIGLRNGMKVGDFGAGSGHYSVAAASLIGSDGRVYAIDVQEDVLKHIQYLAGERKLSNIDTVWGDFEKPFGTKLRDHILDAAILSNVLFQLDDKRAAVEEIKRTLKQGALLLLVDWSGPHGGIGPAASSVVSEKEAVDLFTNADFHKVRSLTSGPHHYGVLFTAP